MLEQAFQNEIRRHQFWPTGAKVIVATSTGVDSMVLLTLLRRLPTALKPQLIVAHVNHELRTESVAEEAYLRQFCLENDLALQVAHWPLQQHPQTGIEAAAREFRYQFFEHLMTAEKVDYLVTAHHGDDQLETLMMKFIRSGELHEMRGIQSQRPFADGTLIRPLLPFAKQDLRDFALANNITSFEDQTNYETTVLRNRVRHTLVPFLKQENGQILQNANRFSQQLTALLGQQAQLATTLLPLLDLKVTDKVISGQLKAIKTLPTAQQTAIWQLIIKQHFPQISPLKETQLQQLKQLIQSTVKPQGQLALGQRILFTKIYDRFQIGETTIGEIAAKDEKSRTLMLNKWCVLPNNEQIGIFEINHLPRKLSGQQLIWLADEQWPIVAKPCQLTDTIMIDKTHHKTLKRLFIDLKVPHEKRQNSWGIWSQETLIGHPEFRISALFNHEQTGKIRYVLCYISE